MDINQIFTADRDGVAHCLTTASMDGHIFYLTVVNEKRPIDFNGVDLIAKTEAH